MKEHSLSHARLAAFGMTRRKGVNARDDPNLTAILDADVDVAVIVVNPGHSTLRKSLGLTPRKPGNGV
jgi:2-isopropylmalate synthase (EC 2.3.3.13)